MITTEIGPLDNITFGDELLIVSDNEVNLGVVLDIGEAEYFQAGLIYMRKGEKALGYGGTYMVDEVVAKVGSRSLEWIASAIHRGSSYFMSLEEVQGLLDANSVQACRKLIG